jgi:methylphosphotriester-DNA--protein-cysteine methyltransferase
MGEIKSTLDLVMEKTKNLNLSDEEREQQKNKEIKDRLRGLVQKFRDSILGADNFRSDYRSLQKEYGLTDNRHLITEICRQIQPAKDNQALFDLLAEFKVSDFEGLRSVLQEFQAALAAAAGQRREILKDRLAKKHFISGSAVVPNLENDAGWREAADKLSLKYQRLLEEAKARMLKGH